MLLLKGLLIGVGRDRRLRALALVKNTVLGMQPKFVSRDSTGLPFCFALP